MFEQNELDAMNDFINNREMSYKDVERKYNIDARRFKKLCEYNNIPHREKTLKCRFNRQALENIQTEEDAYILGFMLADAYVCEQRQSVRIKLQYKDEDILHKINKYFNSNVEIKHEYHSITGNKQSYLSFSSIQLVQTLKKYGICRNKSLNETFYHNMPDDLLRHYVRGIIDGDGFIRKNPNLPQIGLCGSYDVVKNVAIYLKEHLYLNINIDTIVKKREVEKLYQCTICGKKAIRIMQFLYKDSKIYLDRKYELAKRYF